MTEKMINISKEEIRDKMFFINEEDSDQPIAVIKVSDLLEKDMRGAEYQLNNTSTVAINKDFYKTDKSNPINRSDLFQ